MIFLVLTMHHGHRVPANKTLNAPLKGAITWVRHFLMPGNGIHVGRDQFTMRVDASLARSLSQCREDLRPLIRTLGDNDIIEGFNPLCNFIGKNCLGGKIKFCIHMRPPVCRVEDSKPMIFSTVWHFVLSISFSFHTRASPLSPIARRVLALSRSQINAARGGMDGSSNSDVPHVTPSPGDGYNG